MNAELKPGFVGSHSNLHACAIELDGMGLLVKGPSGSGKSSLCHGMIAHYAALKKKAVWISDDQVLLTVEDGLPVARVPDSIAGKAELFGHGIVDVEYKPQTALSLVVVLIPDEKLERMPHALDDVLRIDNREFRLPLLNVPQRHESQSVRLIAAKLSQMTKSQIVTDTGLRQNQIA